MEHLKGGECIGFSLEEELRKPGKSLESVIEAQRELLHSQIDELHKIVVLQCRLTGINPLAQEMAAGALSIKIGRRPRDSLTPKAIKCLQGIFAIKDTVTKREARDISAFCGATTTQVREFFSAQRSRVRRLARQSCDKANNIQVCNTSDGGTQSGTKHSICLTTTLHSQNDVGSKTASKESLWLPNDNSLEDRESFDTNFIKHFFLLMRKEGTFSGQVQLLQRILQIHDATVLCWFVTKGGIPLLAKWLSQASCEEQTTVLHVIFKVLCHLPLHKALPVQMSAILQTVNKLRFYRSSDISNRARILLARWSKIFVRSQSGRKTTSSSSQVHVQKGGVEGRVDFPTKKRADESSKEEANCQNKRVKIDESQECMKKELACTITSNNLSRQSKLFQSSVESLESQGSKRRSTFGQTKERRKVLLVEEPSSVIARRKVNTGAVSKTSSRPLSTDDIQKAKKRAHFLQSKFGELDVFKFDNGHFEKTKPSEVDITLGEDHNKGSCRKSSLQESTISWISVPSCQDILHAANDSVMIKENPVEDTGKDMPEQEPSIAIIKQFEDIQIPWMTPPEIGIDPSWRFASGEESREVEFQSERVKREKESLYPNKMSIPSEPKEPWDVEIDYDDSLTLEIPLEPIVTEDSPKIYSLGNDDRQLQEIRNNVEIESSDSFVGVSNGKTCNDDHPISTMEVSSYTESNLNSIQNTLKQVTKTGAERGPDLELLAVLLKNPDLVFALTSEQGSRFTKAETVALLDLLKATGSKQESFGGGVFSHTSNELDVVSSSSSANAEAIKYDEPLLDTTPSTSVLQSVQGLDEPKSTAAVVSSLYVMQSNHQISKNTLHTGEHGENYGNGECYDLGLKKKQILSTTSNDCVSQALVGEPREQLYRNDNSWSRQDAAKPEPPVASLVMPVLNEDLSPEYERNYSSALKTSWHLVGQNQLQNGNVKKHDFGTIPLSRITEQDPLKTANKTMPSALPVAPSVLKHSPSNGINGPFPVMIPTGNLTKETISQGFSVSFARQTPMYQGHVRVRNGPVISAPWAMENMQLAGKNGRFTQGVLSDDHIDRIRSLVMDFGQDTGKDHVEHSLCTHAVHGQPSNYANHSLPYVQSNFYGPEPVEWFDPRRPPNSYSQRPMPKDKFVAPRIQGAPEARDNHPPSIFHPAYSLSHRMTEPGHSVQPGNFQPQSPWAWTRRRGPSRAGWQ